MDSQTGVFLKDIEIAQAVAQYLGAVGVNVEVQPLASSVFRSALSDGEMSPLFFTGFGSPFIGQTEVARYRESGGPDDAGGIIGKSTHWNNQEYADLYDELVGTFGDDERLEIMYRLQEIVMDELPIIPIWFQVSIYGLSERMVWEAPPHERATFFDVQLSPE
jgi:peptide/nickel transport system substrate-binding protein